MTFAIDAHFLGFKTRIIEKRSSLVNFGDILVLQPSCIRPLHRWPGFWERLQRHEVAKETQAHKKDGTYLTSNPYTSGVGKAEGIAIHRSELHLELFEYATKIGLEVEFDKTVVQYAETSERGSAILDDGTKIEADLVIAADGVGSASWELVLKEKVRATSSGFAVYRSSYTTDVGLANPAVKKFDESQKNKGWLVAFFGHDAHIVISKSETQMSWLLTHKDTKGAIESWDALASPDDVLPWVDGWADVVTGVIRASPPDTIRDWKLMWRDPQPQWASPSGRIIQIGDAAHSFLPTSGYGASMAMEDAYSLVQCVRREPKERFPIAVRAHNLLRFERVSCAQKVGFKNREMAHKTDWAAVAKNPKIMFRNWAPWLLEHDPEAYVESQYDACVKHLVEGAPFKNTNAVPGYDYEPWTVQGFMEASDKNEIPEDAGQWY